MRLVQYVCEGRSVPLNAENAISRMNKECKQALNNLRKGNDGLFRGMYDEGGFFFIEPKKHTRVSANTTNLYTLVIDNNPKWKKYPKRSQSIICATDLINAESYGETYHVIPRDGANFGICPTMDLWASFSNAIRSWSLEDFNYYIEDIMDQMQVRGGYDTYKSLVKQFKKTDDRLINDDPSEITPWFKKEYKGDMLKMVQGILDPVRNGFKQTNNIAQIPSNGDLEVWTDSPSYLVSTEWMDEFSSDLLGHK